MEPRNWETTGGVIEGFFVGYHYVQARPGRWWGPWHPAGTPEKWVQCILYFKDRGHETVDTGVGGPHNGAE